MRKKKGILLAGLLCAGLALSLAAEKIVWVQALFDETEAVHIHAEEIENGTLLIGTHLIHISAMKDEIYEIASNSETESSQTKRYYKSELADGLWFCITNADSLKDITGEGTPAEHQEIEELFLTHHTKSDGITYDLRTGQAVCIFDLTDPYDLEKLRELEPLKLQYDILAGKKDKNKTDQLSEKKIKEFFQMNVRDDETAKLDAQLQGLQGSYASADKEIQKSVLETMEAVDASRRVIVLEKLRKPLEELLQFLQGKEVDISDDKKQKNYFEINSDLNAGASDSIQKIEESLLLYDAKKLSQGVTALSIEAYKVKKAMAEAAETGDAGGIAKAAGQAVLLRNIMENISEDAAKELAYLKETILPAAKNAYFNQITKGAGEEYKNAAFESSASQGLRNQALKDQLNEADRARNELQYLVLTALEKMSLEDKRKFTEELTSEAGAAREGIKEDAFGPYAESSLDAYTNYLDSLKVQGNQTEETAALSKLLEQKQEKQQEKLSALDKNDLAKAAKAEAELEELNQRIEALEQQMSKSGASLAQDTGDVQRTAMQSAQKLADEAVEEILDGKAEGVSQTLAGLEALVQSNPDAALHAVQEVYQALARQAYLSQVQNVSEFEICMAQAEELIEKHAGEFQTFPVLEQEAEELLADLAGTEENQRSREEEAALLDALLKAAEQTGGEEVRKAAQILADRMEESGNPYVFRQYKEPFYEYIPAKSIAACLGFRYVFDNYQKQVTLAKNDLYYTFYVFEKNYEKGGQRGELKMSAGYLSDVFLWEEDARQFFGCSAYYVPGSSLALLVTKDMEEQSSGYLSMLLAKLGG